MPIDKYEANERFAIRLTELDIQPIDVHYTKRRYYKGQPGSNPGGDQLMEDVTIFGRCGNFNVMKFNGKIIMDRHGEDIPKIQQLDEEMLAGLRQLPDYVRNVIEI